MGDSAPQRDARSLREVLVGLNRLEQHQAIKNAVFATNEAIKNYMASRGFTPTREDGKYSNGQILLWDIKPKNVLTNGDGTIFVIDAEIDKL